MHQFIDILINSDSARLLEALSRIAVSLVFGVFIGYERKNRQQIVGIRTLLLICVSSTLLGILSEYAALSTPGAKGDPGRIAAAVITGIGFVGGGAIMHRRFTVKGITTAAIIWMTAAIGLSLGFGLYLPALFAFAITMIALPIFQKIEWKMFPAEKVRLLSLVYADDDIDMEEIRDIIHSHKILINDENLSSNLKKEILTVEFSIHSPRNVDMILLKNQLAKTGKLIKFTFADN